MPTPQLKPLTLRDAKSGEWCTFRPQPDGWIMIPAGTYFLQNEATEPPTANIEGNTKRSTAG